MQVQSYVAQCRLHGTKLIFSFGHLVHGRGLQEEARSVQCRPLNHAPPHNHNGEGIFGWELREEKEEKEKEGRKEVTLLLLLFLHVIFAILALPPPPSLTGCPRHFKSRHVTPFLFVGANDRETCYTKTLARCPMLITVFVQMPGGGDGISCSVA